MLLHQTISKIPITTNIFIVSLYRQIIGDFNFIRSEENRNKPGADMNDIFLFNSIISHHGLIELPLKGRRYTWSNMQDNPLLEQLDWFRSEERR